MNKILIFLLLAAGAATGQTVKLSELSSGQAIANVAPPQVIAASDSGTNTVLAPAALRRTTSATPATGIGTALQWITETSASNNEIGTVLESVTTDATATSEDFDFVVKTMAAGSAAAERLRVGSSGTAVTGSITATGTANRIGTATTANALHDSMFSASATTQSALVVQAKATPTISPFIVEQSNGTNWFEVQSDGGVIIDQRTAATYSRMLDVKYQGTAQAWVDSFGIISSRVGANFGGGFFVTDASGNATGLGDAKFDHYLSGGTSPTAPAGGGTCGTADIAIAGKDSGFKLTVGSVAATSCAVTFGQAWATAPACVASPSATTTAINVATTTTTVTLSAAALTPAEVLHVVCMGF